MTKRRLTYDNVLAMLDKMIENAEDWKKKPGEFPSDAFYNGKIQGLHQVRAAISRAQEGGSSMLDCNWLKDAAE